VPPALRVAAQGAASWCQLRGQQCARVGTQQTATHAHIRRRSLSETVLLPTRPRSPKRVPCNQRQVITQDRTGHREAVRGALYNHVFAVIVSVDEGGTTCVWNLQVCLRVCHSVLFQALGPALRALLALLALLCAAARRGSVSLCAPDTVARCVLSRRPHTFPATHTHARTQDGAREGRFQAPASALHRPAAPAAAPRSPTAAAATGLGLGSGGRPGAGASGSAAGTWRCSPSSSRAAPAPAAAPPAAAAAAGAPDSSANEHGCCVTAVCFDRKQRRLVLASNSGGVTMWNFNNGSLLRRCVCGCVGVCTCVGVSACVQGHCPAMRPRSHMQPAAHLSCTTTAACVHAAVAMLVTRSAHARHATCMRQVCARPGAAGGVRGAHRLGRQARRRRGRGGGLGRAGDTARVAHGVRAAEACRGQQACPKASREPSMCARWQQAADGSTRRRPCAPQAFVWEDREGELVDSYKTLKGHGDDITAMAAHGPRQLLATGAPRRAALSVTEALCVAQCCCLPCSCHLRRLHHPMCVCVCVCVGRPPGDYQGRINVWGLLTGERKATTTYRCARCRHHHRALGCRAVRARREEHSVC
jgi:hypothetical protein